MTPPIASAAMRAKPKPQRARSARRRAVTAPAAPRDPCQPTLNISSPAASTIDSAWSWRSALTANWTSTSAATDGAATGKSSQRSTQTFNAVRDAIPAHACSRTSVLAPDVATLRPATIRRESASMVARNDWRRGNDVAMPSISASNRATTGTHMGWVEPVPTTRRRPRAGKATAPGPASRHSGVRPIRSSASNRAAASGRSRISAMVRFTRDLPGGTCGCRG
jgi:hypothetical protein